MSGDSRKDFLLATIGNFFGYATTDGAISHIADSRELNTFLDDGSCSVLATHAEFTQDVKLIQVYNSIEAEATTDNWLVFFKLEPCCITPENLHTNIFVLSVLDSPIDTLYHTVQKVFAPVLLKDARWSKNINPKIQHLLTELEAGLGSTLRRHGKVGVAQERSLSGSSSGGLQLSGILTPSDEFQYWAEESISSSKLSSRERAQFFQESFQPIVTEFANLDALSFTDVLELVEVTQDTLDDLWKQSDHSPPYPEVRMRHLLEIISSSFGRYVQRKLADLDVWCGQFTQVRSCLQDGLNICEKWSSAADLLTSQFWKQYALHPWKGGPFVSATLLQLTLRLEEVMGLRLLHEQLIHLLSSSEQQEFNLANAFAPFAGEYCSVPGKCPWALKHKSQFWPAWALTWDITSICLYRSCYVDP